MIYGIGSALPEKVMIPDSDIQNVEHVENVAAARR